MRSIFGVSPARRRFVIVRLDARHHAPDYGRCRASGRKAVSPPRRTSLRSAAAELRPGTSAEAESVRTPKSLRLSASATPGIVPALALDSTDSVPDPPPRLCVSARELRMIRRGFHHREHGGTELRLGPRSIRQLTYGFRRCTILKGRGIELSARGTLASGVSRRVSVPSARISAYCQR